MLRLRLLGDIEVSRDGAPQPLPPSKKTRALLAYLALTGRPHRRDRLCTLFWEIADDPRGALRWSLSKIRPLVNEPGHERIVADRESVSFDATEVEIDLADIRKRLVPGVEAVSTEDLLATAEAYRGEFLEGLDLADYHEYQAWCVAEREEARALRASILSTLVGRLDSEPEMALPHARTLVQIDPLDEPARTKLMQLLATAGRLEEAEQQYRAGVSAWPRTSAPVPPMS